MAARGEKQRTVPVSENGRMNLPAEMRRALGLRGAGRVILTQEENAVRITTMEQALKRVRELAQPFRPESMLASDELIADRRAEAARETGEAKKQSDG